MVLSCFFSYKAVSGDESGPYDQNSWSGIEYTSRLDNTTSLLNVSGGSVPSQGCIGIKIEDGYDISPSTVAIPSAADQEWAILLAQGKLTSSNYCRYVIGILEIDHTSPEPAPRLKGGYIQMDHEYVAP